MVNFSARTCLLSIKAVNFSLQDRLVLTDFALCCVWVFFLLFGNIKSWLFLYF